jgi:hypothetical protein
MKSEKRPTLNPSTTAISNSPILGQGSSMWRGTSTSRTLHPPPVPAATALGKKDKHDTYDTWYRKRRLIVASVGVEKICADLGVHEKTVRNWVNALHKSGVIRKLKDGKENVYVLGEVINNEELFYYSGEISWKHEPGSLH